MVASLVAAVAIAVVTTLYSGFSALGQRYVVVHFDTSVGQQERERVQRACADPPTVRAQPVTPGRSSAKGSDVRYRVDKATEADVAVLSKCLKRHEGVLGIDISDLTTG